MRGRFYGVIVLLGIALFICGTIPTSAGKTSHSAAVAVQKGKAKSKKKRRRVPPGPRLYSGVPLTILTQHVETVAPGITYTEETISRNHWRVGIIHADLTSPDSLHVELLKAKDSSLATERVEELVHRIDSITKENVVVAVNANYWRGGTHDVVGGAAHYGELINFDNAKTWSRLFIFKDGSFEIAPESLSVIVYPKNLPPFQVAHANLRFSDSTIVLYNHYFGADVPPLEPNPLVNVVSVVSDSAYKIGELVQNTKPPTDTSARRYNYKQDTSELFYETDEDLLPLPDSLVQTPRSEKRTLKCAFVYLDSPYINASIHCRIIATKDHMIGIPPRGGVLTFPRNDSTMFSNLHIGDSLAIVCAVSPPMAKPVDEMLMGGPRLLRDGKVSVETDQENFHKKSFINGSHARTAIGISSDQKEVILVVVDRPAGTRKSGRPGIGLRDLARILQREGAYDAMNFDGGSSTTLVVNGRTVFPDTGVEFSRHVASALCIISPKKHSQK